MKQLGVILVVFFSLIFPPPLFASSILINEFLSHPSSGNKEWVELYNPDQSDLSSYWIDDDTSFTDDSGSSSKKSLASVVNDNPTYPYMELSSFLNDSGDFVVLFDGSGNIVDQYHYTSDLGTDKSFGRSPDGSSNWILLSSSSKGASNNLALESSSTPTPSPTPSPSPTSTFSISGLPSSTDSNSSQSITVNLSLPSSPNTQFFLKGAFFQSGSTNYFGKTQVGGSWVKNGSSYSSQLPIQTDSAGNWDGQLTVMPDTDDSGYTGSGSYSFKVGRYSSSGDGPVWSNSLNIQINDSSSQTSDSSSDILASSTISPTPLSSTQVEEAPADNAETSDYDYLKSDAIATIAGVATHSATPSSKQLSDKSHLNPWVLFGILLILGGSSALVFTFKKR